MSSKGWPRPPDSGRSAPRVPRPNSLPLARPRPQPAPRARPSVRGEPRHPDLLHPSAPWPRKLSASELATLAVLCDTVVPADSNSPSASAVGVPAYINEYVSAPYDGQMRDLVRVRGGISWLNLESMKRFGRTRWSATFQP